MMDDSSEGPGGLAGSILSMAVRSGISPLKQANGSTLSLLTFKRRRRQKSVSSAGSGTTTPMSEAETAVAGFGFSESVEPEGERPAAISKTSLVSMSLRSASEVNWACASQGIELVHNARVMSQQLGSDPALERKLYLDGLGYLLRGLPVDITASSLEVDNIRASLPKSVLVQKEDASVATEARYCSSSSSRPSVRRSDDTLLRRAVQAMTGLLIVLWLLLWPLISSVMRATAQLAMQLERRYKVAEQLEARVARTLTTTIGHGMDLAAGISRQGVRLSSTLGPSVGEMVVWTLEEVTEGISRGLEQGCQATGDVYKSER